MQNLSIEKPNLKKHVDYVILYHSPCSDGTCAAAIAHMYFRENRLYNETLNSQNTSHTQPNANIIYVEAIAGTVDQVVYSLINEYDQFTKVLAFDLAFTYTAAKALLTYFDDAQIYDHHKTTLDCWRKPDNESDDQFAQSLVLFNKKITYDETISGAMLAWKHFYGDAIPPLLVQYVQDRDLYKWELPDSREINAGIFGTMGEMYPYQCDEPLDGDPNPKLRSQMHWLDAWSKFLCNQPTDWMAAAKYRGSILVGIIKQKTRMLSRDGATYRIGDHQVYVCNTNDYISEIGEYWYTFKNNGSYAYDYVAIWRYDHKRNICMVSLRARKDSSVDVSQIAKQFAYTDPNGLEVRGGGHQAAAGFEVSIDGLFSWLSNRQ